MILWKCCLGCLRFGSHPTWQRITIHVLCLPSERGMGMGTVGRSCSQLQSRSHCGVVHSPSDLLYHRLPLQAVVLRALRRLQGCLRHDVVWWSRWCLQFYLGQLEAVYWKYICYFLYQDVVECVCMLNDGSAVTTRFAPTTTSFPGSRCRTSVAVRSGSCICTVTRPSRWSVSAWNGSLSVAWV